MRSLKVLGISSSLLLLTGVGGCTHTLVDSDSSEAAAVGLALEPGFYSRGNEADGATLTMSAVDAKSLTFEIDAWKDVNGEAPQNGRHEAYVSGVAQRNGGSYSFTDGDCNLVLSVSPAGKLSVVKAENSICTRDPFVRVDGNDYRRVSPPTAGLYTRGDVAQGAKLTLSAVDEKRLTFDIEAWGEVTEKSPQKGRHEGYVSGVAQRKGASYSFADGNCTLVISAPFPGTLSVEKPEGAVCTPDPFVTAEGADYRLAAAKK